MVFLSVIFFFAFSNILSFQTKNFLTFHKKEASQWVKQYAKNCSQDDLYLVMNLIYWSYKRSVSTLEAQQSAHDMLEAVWCNWQNIAATRLNPSHILPYSYTHLQTISTLFEQKAIEHRIVGLTYAHCIEHIVKNKSVSKEPYEGIQLLRKKARNVISVSILSSVIGIRTRSVDPVNFLSFNFNFLSTLPDVFVQPFASVNKNYTDLAELCWQKFMQAQKTADTLWQNIEESRALLYYEYYGALYTFIENNYSSSIPILFDASGLLNSSNKVLPKPEYL